MPISKPQQAAVARYSKAHYDMISIRLPKGYRDRIQKAATAAGVSSTAYIRAAIDAAIEKAPE